MHGKNSGYCGGRPNDPHFLANTYGTLTFWQKWRKKGSNSPGRRKVPRSPPPVFPSVSVHAAGHFHARRRSHRGRITVLLSPPNCPSPFPRRPRLPTSSSTSHRKLFHRCLFWIQSEDDDGKRIELRLLQQQLLLSSSLRPSSSPLFEISPAFEDVEREPRSSERRRRRHSRE